MGFTLLDYALTFEVADVSDTPPGYVIAPFAGEIIKAYCVVEGTTNGAAVLTLNVDGGTDITQTISIASGGGAGDKDECTPADNNRVEEGSIIKATSDGGGSTAVLGRITLIIRR